VLNHIILLLLEQNIVWVISHRITPPIKLFLGEEGVRCRQPSPCRPAIVPQDSTVGLFFVSVELVSASSNLPVLLLKVIRNLRLTNLRTV
jgi:hypothetical protein